MFFNVFIVSKTKKIEFNIIKIIIIALNNFNDIIYCNFNLNGLSD